MKRFTLASRSPADTRALAARLGALLQAGDVVALYCELGSGKTEFVRGLAAGLEVPSKMPVTSPSFALAHEYLGRLTLVHLDLYRLDRVTPDFFTDLEEYLLRGPGGGHRMGRAPGRPSGAGISGGSPKHHGGI